MKGTSFCRNLNFQVSEIKFTTVVLGFWFFWEEAPLISMTTLKAHLEDVADARRPDRCLTMCCGLQDFSLQHRLSFLVQTKRGIPSQAFDDSSGEDA